MEIIEVLKALSDETRIRMMNILKTGEYCATDIEMILKISQSDVSKHLEELKSIDIISAKKETQWVYFSINDSLIKKYTFVEELLKNCLDEDILTQDFMALVEYLNAKEEK